MIDGALDALDLDGVGADGDDHVRLLVVRLFDV
jgi:hypothetical protein